MKLFQATPEVAQQPLRKRKVTHYELAAIIRQYFGASDLTQHQRAFIEANYQVVRYEPMPLPESADHHAQILAAQKAARDEFNAGIESPVYVPPVRAPSNGVFF